MDHLSCKSVLALTIITETQTHTHTRELVSGVIPVESFRNPAAGSCSLILSFIGHHPRHVETSFKGSYNIDRVSFVGFVSSRNEYKVLAWFFVALELTANR